MFRSFDGSCWSRGQRAAAPNNIDDDDGDDGDDGDDDGDDVVVVYDNL